MAYINGKVRDSQTGKGIPQVRVTLNTGESKLTDNTGYFIFRRLSSGIYTLTVTKTGYDTTFFSVNVGSYTASINLTPLPVIPVPPPPIPPIPTGLCRINLKSYGNHDEISFSNKLGKVPYDERIKYVKPVYLIDNPPHGLYGEMDEERYHEGYTYSYLLQDVAGMQALGIKVIGYVTCGYEGKGGGDHYASKWYSLSMLKKLITNMAVIDKVDGVFIDECSESPNSTSKTYLKTLTDLAHSYGLIVWGNTGVDQFDSWFFTSGGFDLMQSSEEWVGQTLSPVQSAYGSRIGVTGFKKNYTLANAVSLTRDAWDKGIEFCFINDREYTDFAPWFEDYADELKSISPVVLGFLPILQYRPQWTEFIIPVMIGVMILVFIAGMVRDLIKGKEVRLP